MSTTAPAVEHKAIQVFAIDPPVVRCSCGHRIVVRADGDLRRHLTTGQGGEAFPWNDAAEDAEGSVFSW